MKPGDYFTIKPAHLKNYGQQHAGRVFEITKTVHAYGDDLYMATGLAIGARPGEIEPHPGPATPAKPKSRRRKGFNLRTPARRFEDDIFTAIERHHIGAQEAMAVLLATVQAIEHSADTKDADSKETKP